MLSLYKWSMSIIWHWISFCDRNVVPSCVWVHIEVYVDTQVVILEVQYTVT